MSAPLVIGRRYFLENQQPLSGHGVIGDYRVDSQKAEIVPLIPSASGKTAFFFWDDDCDLKLLAGAVKTESENSLRPLSEYRLRTNRLEMNQAALNGPEINPAEQGALLTLSPNFVFTYTTDAFTARLGMLHLVQAKRYIVLANGEQITLLDSGDEADPVLYLEHSDDSQPMKWMSAEQKRGESKEYSVNMTISQTIPEHFLGEAVVNVTVLERYSSYLMQRGISLADNLTIWTPIHPPLSWGWSIRVGCRSDSDWAIMRRKLMLPISGHDGLQIPLWNRNSFACSKAFDIGN
ncbi:MAG: hypothetical protein ACU85E_16080 [Gammaproteobacteria bacterium]